MWGGCVMSEKVLFVIIIILLLIEDRNDFLFITMIITMFGDVNDNGDDDNFIIG